MDPFCASCGTLLPIAGAGAAVECRRCGASLPTESAPPGARPRPHVAPWETEERERAHGARLAGTEFEGTQVTLVSRKYSFQRREFWSTEGKAAEGDDAQGDAVWVTVRRPCRGRLAVEGAHEPLSAGPEDVSRVQRSGDAVQDLANALGR